MLNFKTGPVTVTETETRPDTYTLIAKWGAERNITTGGSSLPQQALKLAEERFELGRAFANNDADALFDSIGDQVVVLTMLASMVDIEVQHELLFPELEDGVEPLSVTKITEILPDGAFTERMYDRLVTEFSTQLDTVYEDLIGAIARGKPCLDAICTVSHTLSGLCWNYGISYTACVELAYGRIKDRKGEMRDGVFVKEEDL